jgi:GH25 family lysozyme M1 (1,4-beta-N-acetylmuramidase)
MLNGIDVSVYQGSIDWAKAKESVDFAILRAGYGRYSSQKDPRFEEYYAGCKKNGIPVGVYWASYAITAEDAVLEAKACIECIAGKHFEYPIAFDYEAFPGAQDQLKPEVARAVITAFMEEMKKAGYYVALYSYYSMLKCNIPADVSSKYDIFLAHYASETNWDNKTVWQYSCKGRVNGIDGDVDLDRCYVDYVKIIKESGLPNGVEATPTPKPDTYPIDVDNPKDEVISYDYYDKTQLTEHFNVQEFKCKCGNPHPILINSKEVAMLERLRKTMKSTSINISSGYRCVQHDKNVGGSGTGYHTKGYAADFCAYDENHQLISTKRLACAMQDLGFTGIANINSTYTYIHGDVRPGKWYGDEYKYGNNGCLKGDFYAEYGLTKEDVYGKDETPVEEKEPEPVNPDPTPDPIIDPKPTPSPITTGSIVNLNNTPVYASATSKSTIIKKSGTFFTYSDEVVNGRIRITNTKSNVGKTPAGSFVTGWVNVSDINTDVFTSDTIEEPIKKEDEPKNNIAAGTKLNLKSVALYSSVTATKYSSKKTGTFYIYSDEIINRRIRITNTKANVGKTPVGTYVTGWINVSDIK